MQLQGEKALVETVIQIIMVCIAAWLIEYSRQDRLKKKIADETRREMVGEVTVTIFQIHRSGDQLKLIEKPDGTKSVVGVGDPKRCSKAYQYLYDEGFLD